MSDLVERLREYSLSPTVQAEAADTIERLQARCAELERNSVRLNWLIRGSNFRRALGTWDGMTDLLNHVDTLIEGRQWTE